MTANMTAEIEMYRHMAAGVSMTAASGLFVTRHEVEENTSMWGSVLQSVFGT